MRAATTRQLATTLLVVALAAITHTARADDAGWIHPDPNFVVEQRESPLWVSVQGQELLFTLRETVVDEGRVRLHENMQEWHALRAYFMQANAEGSWRTAALARMAAQLALGYVQAVYNETRSLPLLYQARYTVPFGSYSGDGLFYLNQTLSQGLCPATHCRTFSRGDRPRPMGGWSFEQGGVLVRTWTTRKAWPCPYVRGCNPSTGLPPGPGARCEVVERYRYYGPRGVREFRREAGESACEFELAVGPNLTAPMCASQAAASVCPDLPTRYRSTDGQVVLDMTDASAPVLLYPTGVREIFGVPAGASFCPSLDACGGVSGGPTAALVSSGATSREERGWVTAATIDVHGNTTRYEYDPAGWLVRIVDARDRATSFGRDGAGRVVEVVRPGPGGRPLTWSLEWSEHAWDLGAEFGALCNVPAGCGQHAFTTLDRMVTPDGRAFAFSYGRWGNLTRVSTPEGAVVELSYGGASTTTHTPTDLDPGRLPCDYVGPECDPAPTRAVLGRRLVSTTTYPLGAAGPSLTWRIDHEEVDSEAGADELGKCRGLAWRRETAPDGSYVRRAFCIEAPPSYKGCGSGACYGPGSLNGLPFIEEIRGASGELVQRTELGDPATRKLFMAWETAPEAVGDRKTYLDLRQTKVVRERDGARYTEIFEYDEIDVAADGGRRRTGGNVVRHRTLDANGVLLLETETSHVTAPDLIARNLVRLPASVVVRDGARVLARTETRYDEAPLEPSGAPNLDPNAGAIRGNPTTLVRYLDPAAASGAVETHRRYYDTGDLREETDALGRVTVHERSLGACTGDDFLRRARVISPPPEPGAAPHVGHAVTDCFTGRVLSERGPNGARTCTQYDALGRLVETAVAGDALSALPEGVRDPACALSGLVELGSAGRGPTSWVRYFGSGEGSVVETRTKNGSPHGLWSVSYLDGLQRVVASCVEVDSATHAGANAVCTTSEYDPLGRLYRVSVPFHAQAPGGQAPSRPASVQYTETRRDVLGRPTRVELVGSGLPAETTSYASAAGLFVARATDRLGRITDTFTNALGHTVGTARPWDGCLGGSCTVAMERDGLGRLSSITGPRDAAGQGGHVARFSYDGLGRKSSAEDPDRGRSTYEYDAQGSLVATTDARGVRIELAYDALGRITRRDLPPLGPGPEDVLYFYDGRLPK
jgi:YD repeat-containing protein